MKGELLLNRVWVWEDEWSPGDVWWGLLYNRVNLLNVTEVYTLTNGYNGIFHYICFTTIKKKFFKMGNVCSWGHTHLSKGYIVPDVFKGVVFSVLNLYIIFSRTDIPWSILVNGWVYLLPISAQSLCSHIRDMASVTHLEYCHGTKLKGHQPK